jgi:PPOX class probable F420-dependent enzyme
MAAGIVACVPRTMDDAEWRAFVSEGTRTGKLATTRHDGRPHVVPIWFVLDGDDFVFNTGEHTIKGRSLARNGIAALCIDDDRAPYAFVSVTGTITITRESGDLRRWATAIGERYMGADRADEFGARNAVQGELLVRLHADHVFAQADVAEYA